MALPWEQWHALVSKVTDIHGLTSAVETMKDDKSLQKMQDLTNRLALAGVDTQEKVWGLYQSWLKTTPLGKKAAKGNKRPLGSNLTDHASDLIDRGIMINGIIVSAQLGNSTGTQSGGVEGGDIDYTALAEQSSTVGLSEVPLGFSDN